jgi:hypothetical protein
MYMSDDVNNNLVKVDAKTGEIKSTISLPGPNHYLQPSRDGRQLYAVNEARKEEKLL